MVYHRALFAVMSDSADLRRNIKSALAAVAGGDFLPAAKNLLAAMEYRSRRTLELSGGVESFIGQFPAPNPNTKTERNFIAAVQSARMIFQITGDEVAAANQQGIEFSAPAFDRGENESFMFWAVELKKSGYSRGQYAEFTREINKRLGMPSVVLFVAEGRVTLAFVRRRRHKTDDARDVLGGVSLVREIDINRPHRAHLDILSDLSLPNLLHWMGGNNKQKNFDGLLAAWLAKLDTRELNKRFYKELFKWYEWAKCAAKFPLKKDSRPENHVIRLITRILFIWFIKEKGFIDEELFIEAKAAALLKNGARGVGDYYRAILQNLFFATLNTEPDKRRFSKVANETHRNFGLYRYADLIRDKEKLLAAMRKTPFVNGGLFDCLDSELATGEGGWRIDCFSDDHTARKMLSVPDELFFDEEQGLIPLLNKYKFTVEENTPLESEVALDPELLGMTFENLLATYNEETGRQARKESGSFYTPRAIVAYMVERSLVQYLTNELTDSKKEVRQTQGSLSGKEQGSLRQSRMSEPAARTKLETLFLRDETENPFNEAESDRVIAAIHRVKVLDPAAGSGAFPMEVLHCLTGLLAKLDPDNQKWKAQQLDSLPELESILRDIAVVEKISDNQAREKAKTVLQARARQIRENFERHDHGYSRKLYLIQDCIYGVDKEPIACQIAKLRFFISLVIEQKYDPRRENENFGVQPLPNLETKFIAADTLLRLAGIQYELESDAVKQLKAAIDSNRKRHFDANTRTDKLASIAEDKKLRGKLSAKLAEAIGKDDAQKIAEWEPFDQNAAAEWFDAEYMFNVAGGFDVVVGNPPYVTYGINQKYKDMSSAFKKRIPGVRNTANLFCFFTEKAILLLSKQGTMSFIVPHSISRVDGYQYIRDFIEKNSVLWEIADQHHQFENVTLEMVSFFCGKGLRPACIKSISNREGESDKKYFMPKDVYRRIGYYPIYYDDIYKKMTKCSAGRISGYRGINESALPSGTGGARVLYAGGKNIRKYFVELGHSEIYIPKIEGKFRFKKEEIVITQFGALPRGVIIDTDSVIPSDGCVVITHDSALESKFVLSLINSHVVGYYFHRYIMNHANLTVHLDGHYLSKIPTPNPAAAEQAPFVALVDKILAAKKMDPAADTGEWEREIDRMVYKLYGLTADEIALVEGRE